MASLFENGTWHISPEIACHGKEEVRDWLEENLIVHGDKLGTRHVVSNIVTDVADDGETAVSSSYVHVTQVTEEFPLQLISQACYQDSFAKTNGEWHFVDRKVLSDGIGDMSHHRRDARPERQPHAIAPRSKQAALNCSRKARRVHGRRPRCRPQWPRRP
jgi:hypothetical protein